MTAPGPDPVPASAWRRAAAPALAVVTLVACVLTGSATAQKAQTTGAPEAVDAPVHVDPAVCTPTRSGAWLPLGSERIAVIGVDHAGDCIVELFAETEGGYVQWICRFAPDAPGFLWDPLGRRDIAAQEAWFAALQPDCATTASGNFLRPGAKPVIFPRTPWGEARHGGSDGPGDGPSDATGDDR